MRNDRYNLFETLFDSVVSEFDTVKQARTVDDGVKVETFKKGRLHGEVKYHDGKTPSEYFIEGRQVTKGQWDNYVQDIEDKTPHSLYLDGHRYVVSGKQFRKLKQFLTDIGA